MNEINWAIARKREKLIARARIIQQIRAFFAQRDYLEVETPQRIPANAPEPHIDAVPSNDWVLQTSPELAMKRLLAAGHQRLFQICRVWRQGERGSQHLPEFTLLEWYRSQANYSALMDECEQLLLALAPTGAINWQGTDIQLTPPWDRLTVAEAFERYASLSLQQALSNDRFEEILTDEIEPRLGYKRPLFLTEYPAEMAALARKKPEHPEVAERFELYINGLEVANAFSELTDPVEQRQRFEQDEATRVGAGKPPQPLPEKFLREMHHLPDCAGIALGIDRLIMLLTEAKRIGDVVAFTPEEL
ncbi:MAG: EF-P lysine aminoacylase EpmA [Desulfuromonadales bacterium]|nr:EF-P lysine aminoacylase EpmA [Desulfuromonadales bacterium]